MISSAIDHGGSEERENGCGSQSDVFTGPKECIDKHTHVGREQPILEVERGERSRDKRVHET